MLDIIAIAVIVLYAYKGWKRGMILSIFSIIGYIVSLAVARAYSAELTNFLIENTGIDKFIDGFLGDKIRTAVQIDLATDMMTGFATNAVINAIAFFIIFSVTSLIIFNLGKLLNGINRIPVIGKINRFGGMIFGTIKSLILIFIILAVISLVVSAGNYKLEEAISDTILVDSMYKNNPIVSVFSDLFSPSKTDEDEKDPYM